MDLVPCFEQCTHTVMSAYNQVPLAGQIFMYDVMFWLQWASNLPSMDSCSAEVTVRLIPPEHTWHTIVLGLQV
jgi:hypothetical protein